MSVRTVVPLPGKDLTEAMNSTAGRHSHIFVVAIAVLLGLAFFVSAINVCLTWNSPISTTQSLDQVSGDMG
jgi:hypothetical protein